jgi:DNA-binding IscR family transcriptional regulator
MRKDSRLSRTLHVLLHMARLNRALTSEVIARMFDTNPVVIRRMMAGLRNRGYVRSENGRGGGWTIACELDAVTLLDIHEALGEPRILSLGNDHDHPECAVEQIVNASLNDAFTQARAILVAQLRVVTLGQLAREFDEKCRKSGWDERASRSGAVSEKSAGRKLPKHLTGRQDSRNRSHTTAPPRRRQ